jgi:cystathionine gamma-synthase
MSLPCGKRIPASEHAVSLSLPTLRDVIGYEEKSEAVFRHVCSGYPRFVRHWTVERVQALLQAHFDCAGPVVALHEPAACARLMDFLQRDLKVLDGLPFGAVELPVGDARLMAEAQRFQQHTGLMLSSRQAEDWLGKVESRKSKVEIGDCRAQSADYRPQANPASGVGRPEFSRQRPTPNIQRPTPSTFNLQPSTRHDEPGTTIVRHCLAGIYGVSEKAIGLYPAGMNAYFSVFDTLNRLQHARGREQWLQVGWLYLDTTAILDRFATRQHLHFAATAADDIEAYIAAHHADIAGITTEVMTNPLLQTPDLVRLSAVARRFNLPLIVDISMPTPVNVEVFPYADVVIESLTKFASGHADVMGGAAVFNAQSEWGQRLRDAVPDGTPYVRDLQHLAQSIQGYAPRMAVINANTAALAAYFRSSRAVRAVHWAGQPDSAAAYAALRRPGAGDGGVVSVVFEKPLETVYDRLELLKGPSFGTEFTLCMAYVYMAHYDLVTTPEGRERLRREGISPDLLRISVGMEPIDDLIRAFETACL